MFVVFYSFYFRIPAFPAILAFVILKRRRAIKIFVYYLGAVGPRFRRRPELRSLKEDLRSVQVDTWQASLVTDS